MFLDLFATGKNGILFIAQVLNLVYIYKMRNVCVCVCVCVFTQSRADKLKEGRRQRELLMRRDLERKEQHERLLEARPAK